VWLNWLNKSSKNRGGEASKAKQNPDFKKLPNLLTIDQVSEILNVHPNTLRNWDKTGKLKAVRIGPRRDRRYEKEYVGKIYKSLAPTQKPQPNISLKPEPSEPSYVLKPGLSWRWLKLLFISKKFSVFVYYYLVKNPQGTKLIL